MLLLFSLGSYADSAECEWTGYKNGAKVSGPTQSTLSAAFNDAPTSGANAVDSVAITLLKSVTLNSRIQINQNSYSISVSNPNNDTIFVSDSFIYGYIRVNVGLSLYDVNVKGSTGSQQQMILARQLKYFKMIGGSVWVTSSSVSTASAVIGIKFQETPYYISRSNIVMSPSTRNYPVEAIEHLGKEGTIENSSISIYTDVPSGNSLTISSGSDSYIYGIYAKSSSTSAVCNANFNNIVIQGKKVKGLAAYTGGTIKSNGNIIVLPYADEVGGDISNLYSLWAKHDVSQTGRIIVHGGIYSGELWGGKVGSTMALELQSGFYTTSPATDVYDTNTMEINEVWQGANKYYEVRYKNETPPAGTSKYTASIYCGDSKAFNYTDYLETGVAPTFLSEADNVLVSLYPSSNAIAFIELPEDTTGMGDGAFDYRLESFPKSIAIKYYNQAGYFAREINLKDEDFYTPEDITISSADKLTYNRQFKTRTLDADTISLGTVCLPFAIDGTTVDGKKCELLNIKGYADREEGTEANPEEQAQRILFTAREDALPANTPSFINVGNGTDFGKDYRSDTCDVWNITFVAAEPVLHRFAAGKKDYDIDGGSNKMWLCGTDTTYTHVGTEQCKFWAMNQDGKTLGWINDGQTVKPMRAYIMFNQVPESFLSTTSGAPMFCMLLNDVNQNDGQVTGVVKTFDEATSDAELVNVYSADGQLLRKGVVKRDAFNGLGSGIYVVGGQKYILR